MTNTNTNTQAVAIENNNLNIFLKEELTIGTHNGVFHADDVFSVAVINYARKSFGLSPAKVVRSRLQEKWNLCDTLVDVGEGTYDHHGSAMQHCGDRWANYPTVPASAFKLVLEALEEVCPWVCYFETLALQIAAQDNGVKSVEVAEVLNLEFVKFLNPTWVEDFKEIEDKQFEIAVEMAEVMLEALIRNLDALEAAGEQYMIIADKGADPTDFSVEIVAGLPDWQKAVCDFWDADYVFFEGSEGTWYIQCVPETAEDVFSKRKPLPEEWAGARDKDLGSRIQMAIPDFSPEDAVFCHIGRFIMGVKSREAAKAVLSYLATLHV